MGMKGKQFHGYQKESSYFEGWYVKHQCGEQTLALIPGIHMDRWGNKKAFIQVITQREAHFVEYPYESFRVKPSGFAVKVGESVFSEKGCHLYLSAPGFTLYGTLRYGPFSPLCYDIMGPLKAVPFLQCNHGVLSMSHSLRGELTLNGETLCFTGGDGYIEKDWGSSFPQEYLWTQCGGMAEGRSVVAMAAQIQVAGAAFYGCTAAVIDCGQEYRLATYLGAQILEMDERTLHLRQRGLRLRVDLLEGTPLELKAPRLGEMDRLVRESPACRVRYRFYENDRLRFDLESGGAGFESAGLE